MSEYDKPPSEVARQDAIDVSDFVYAATGARVRRLTMPDGEHWFPAVDVCDELGHTNARKALADHVHTGGRATLESVTSRYGLRVPAGREWRRDLNMVNLQGLIRLVNACSKPEADSFKAWVSEVVVSVQRHGAYELNQSSVPAAVDNAASGYVIPVPLMETIARLEERNVRLDEQFATEHEARLGLDEQSLEVRRESLAVQRERLTVQREQLAVLHLAAQSLHETARALTEASRALKDVAMAQLRSTEVHNDLARTLERINAALARQAPDPDPQPGMATQPRQPDLGCAMPVIDAMSWHEFEEYVARLLRRDGCTEVHVSGRRGDLGADIIGRTPDGRRIVVQCKHYAPHRTVPNADMQKFVGTALLEYKAEVALFVATCGFTPAALELAERRSITAVSRSEFQDWNEGRVPAVLRP